MPGPGWYFFGEEEKLAVLEVLEDRELSRYRFDADPDAKPSKVFQFEREMEERLGVAHVLGTNSGTSALYLALVALGVGPGDEVIVPGYTFIATMSAVVHARAAPVLAEIDESLTLDPEDVRKKISSATKAIIPVHMLGNPCAMDELRAIADEHGLAILEDVAQACGASYRGRRLGAIGDAGAFSLNVFKMITAGDGGWLSTQRADVYERAFALHDQGFRPLRVGVTHAENATFGLNLKMHELCGALALAQGRKLEHILAEVRRRKQALVEALGPIAKAERRVVNDPEGECGTLLVHRYPDVTTARAVAEALGTMTLIDSGRHYYGNMPPLFGRRVSNLAGCPFHCPSNPSSVVYSDGMLPRTDDVLGRSVAISVGVVDSYLGSGFGVDVMAEPEQIEAVARDFHERTRSVLGA